MTSEASDSTISFGADGLIPVVIQDASTNAVLMVGFMNELALQKTRETGRTHFWSRSRSKLWRKGETSGHEQAIESIFVNCERNSLLITVQQVGAACHDGFPTCYYRKVEEDGSLTVVRERWFDPADVYDTTDGESLEGRTRRWFGAYEYLRDNDLSEHSGTSKRLRDPGQAVHNRIAEELRELAGVLTGEHRHSGLIEDVELEGSQSLYWLAIAAVKADVPWSELRPDRALISGDTSLPISSIARILQREAESWESPSTSGSELTARIHAAIALVAQAALAAHVPPITLIRRDLDELASKPYLQPYFF